MSGVYDETARRCPALLPKDRANIRTRSTRDPYKALANFERCLLPTLSSIYRFFLLLVCITKHTCVLLAVSLSSYSVSKDEYFAVHQTECFCTVVTTIAGPLIRLRALNFRLCLIRCCQDDTDFHVL